TLPLARTFSSGSTSRPPSTTSFKSGRGPSSIRSSRALTLKPWTPLRIAAFPGVTLQVVIRDKVELSLGSLQTALPCDEIDKTTSPNYDSTITASGRCSEAAKDEKSPATSNNNTTPTSQSAEPPRVPQKTASDAAKHVAKTMMNARLGHNKSLIALGDMYRDGRGVRQDYKAAMNRYKKAADVGYAEAQCNIGQLYYNGQGVACDHYEAFRWYTLAANQGYARGIHILGILYSWGRGLPYPGNQNFGRAAEYYLEATNQGYAPAQCDLGWLHQRGLGVNQNYSLAMEWYLKDSDQGHADNQAAEKGHAAAKASAGVIASMSKAYHRMRLWRWTGIEKPLSKATTACVPLKREEAVIWYKKAADGGDADAKEKLEELEHQSDEVESKE
ncbi:hypothetical protein BGZ91_011299, partial [Linnemannia elongata]